MNLRGLHEKKKKENLFISHPSPPPRPQLNNEPSLRQIQWNLDLTKCQGTEEICSLYRGFVISKTSI